MMYLGKDAVGLANKISGQSIELIKTYRVTESWENDTLGNPITIINTIMPNLTTDYSSLLIFMFNNNQASNTAYKVDAIFILQDTPNNNSVGGVIRNNKTVTRSMSASTSSWASVGTIVDVYKLDCSNLWEVTPNA